MAEQYTSHLQLREAHAELQLSEDVFEAGGAQQLRIAQDVPPHSIPLNVIIGQVERRQGPQRSQTRIGLAEITHVCLSSTKQTQHTHNTLTHTQTQAHTPATQCRCSRGPPSSARGRQRRARRLVAAFAISGPIPSLRQMQQQISNGKSSSCATAAACRAAHTNASCSHFFQRQVESRIFRV